MVDTQYKSTDEVMTESQWLKKGYIVKDTATGIKGWNNRHCTYKVTRYSKDEVYEDIETAKARIKKIRHKEYEDAKARKASCAIPLLRSAGGNRMSYMFISVPFHS